MRARIHRGAHEIGGNCIELATGDERLVLDLGRPLSAGWGDDVPLPAIEGLAARDPHMHGVVLSHPHLDHYVLAEQLSPDVPVYLGTEAARVLEAASFFSPVSKSPPLAGHLSDRVRLQLGPFTITPYLADHSAFDAYSLLVEAGGRRLFYTGDIRAHGRKSRLFERLVGDPPRADVLLMEGTHVRRVADDAPRSSEQSVEDDLVETFRTTAGLVAIFSSAQNLDRLVTVYRAARSAGRTLVVDLYTASVARATGRSTIPQPGFDGFAVYVPRRQRQRVLETQEFDRVAEIADVRRYPEDLATGRGKLAYLGTSSTAEELVDAGALRDGAVAWSLWTGYLDQPAGQRLRDVLAEAEVPLVHHHTSGHAFVEDLQRLVAAFDPARVVPIHSEATDRFADHFARVEPHPDGTWWDV
jgi:ribonuclease J